MQVIKELTSDVSASIEVKISKADFEPEVNKALKEYQRKASVPGFRPGKVPFGMVKKIYGNAILAEEVNKLVSNALNNYLNENEMRVLGYPLSDIERTGLIDFDSDSDKSFFFNVAIAPTLDFKLEEMEFSYPRVKADPAEVQKAVDKLLVDFPEITYPDTFEKSDSIEMKATEADAEGNEVEDGYQATVNLDPDAIVNDESFSLLEGKELGSEFIFNFGKALQDDEKVIKALRLSEENNNLIHNDFNVVIDEIKRVAPAEVNESFFRRVFPADEIDNEEDFRNRIAQEIEKQLESQSDFYVFNVAFKKLVEETPMQFDEEFLQKWIADSSNGEYTFEEIRDNYKDYEKTIRFQLIEEELLRQHPQLKVSKEDVRRHVAGYFMNQMQMDITPEMEGFLNTTIDSILKNKKEEDRIVRQLFENKMVKVFKENLKLIDKIVTPDEFKEMITQNGMELKEDQNNE